MSETYAVRENPPVALGLLSEQPRYDGPEKLPRGALAVVERRWHGRTRAIMGAVARVEIGGRRQGQEVWVRWIDGQVQGDREFLRAAGLDPGTRFEDPHAFVELIQGLLDQGTANVVLDVPPRPA